MSNPITVAVVPGSLVKTRMMRVRPDVIEREMRRQMRCKIITTEPVSPVHILYRPGDGPYKDMNWFIVVRATDALGETLVDMTDTDIGELPRILKRHDETAGEREAFARLMMLATDREQNE